MCGLRERRRLSKSRPPSANRSKFRNNPRFACNNGGFSCNNGRYFRINRGFSETTKEQPKRPARIITRNGLFRGEIASCTTYLRFICNLRFAPPPFLLIFAPFVHFFYSIGFCGRLLCGAAARLFRSIQEKHNAPPRFESLNTWIYHTICPFICRVTTFCRPGGQLHGERKKTRENKKNAPPEKRPRRCKWFAPFRRTFARWCFRFALRLCPRSLWPLVLRLVVLKKKGENDRAFTVFRDVPSFLNI